MAQKSSLRERVKEGVEEEEAEEEEEEVKESLDADRVGRRNWGCRREEGVMELLLKAVPLLKPLRTLNRNRRAHWRAFPCPHQHDAQRSSPLHFHSLNDCH